MNRAWSSVIVMIVAIAMGASAQRNAREANVSCKNKHAHGWTQNTQSEDLQTAILNCMKKGYTEHTSCRVDIKRKRRRDKHLLIVSSTQKGGK